MPLLDSMHHHPRHPPPLYHHYSQFATKRMPLLGQPSLPILAPPRECRSWVAWFLTLKTCAGSSWDLNLPSQRLQTLWKGLMYLTMRMMSSRTFPILKTTRLIQPRLGA